MTWQTEFDNLEQHGKSSLCELLIIRSLIDLAKYDSDDAVWNGVRNKSDHFVVTQTLLTTTRQIVSNRVSNQLDFHFRYPQKLTYACQKI